MTRDDERCERLEHQVSFLFERGLVSMGMDDLNRQLLLLERLVGRDPNRLDPHLRERLHVELERATFDQLRDTGLAEAWQGSWDARDRAPESDPPADPPMLRPQSDEPHSPPLPLYQLHSTAGDDLGLLEHPAPNLEPGDTVELADGREGLITSRVEAVEGSLTALLVVLVASHPPAIAARDRL